MPTRRLFLGSFIVATAGLVGSPAPVRAQLAIDYVIAPFHPGIFDSWFFEINNRGQATGYVRTRNTLGVIEQNAVIYRDGALQVLASGSINDGLFGNTGLAINDRGEVAGTREQQPTFFAASGAPTPIVTPGLDFANVRGLNDAGRVLLNGFSPDRPDVSERLGLWSQSGFRILNALDPLYPNVLPPDPDDFLSGPSSFAFSQGITGLSTGDRFAAGVRRGDFDPGDPNDPDDDIFVDQFLHAYVFDGQDGYNLLEPTTPGVEIEPIDIDLIGSVFGWAGDRLALWGSDGSLESILPDFEPGLRRSGFFGYPTVQRNNLGQVVAVTDLGGVAMYDPGSSIWTDLTPSISGLGSGTIDTIQGYNDLGQFVGLARPSANAGGVFAYQVSAVPEPSSLALSAIGIGCCGLWALRRTTSHSGILMSLIPPNHGRPLKRGNDPTSAD